MNEAVDQSELSRRVAILRRFRDMLGRQRERLQSYLDLLENQESVIGSGSGEQIIAHVELEEQIVADIFSIQRVINPLEEMYRAVAGQGSGDDGIPELRISLDDMKARVQAQSAKNRELLSARMASVRTEMDVLKDSPFAKNARHSGFGEIVTASLIDVQG